MRPLELMAQMLTLNFTVHEKEVHRKPKREKTSLYMGAIHLYHR